MKVEAISLALIATLAVAAAIPLGGGAVSMEREERARKDSAKLRLLEAALAHGRQDKERRPEFVHPKDQEGDQEVFESKVIVTKSESSRQAAKVSPTTVTTAAPDTTTYPATTKSDFTLRLEKQRSVADQALRDRLMRHTGPQKEPRGVSRNSPQGAPVKVQPPLQDVKEEVDSGTRPTIPPVVYVPLSEAQDTKMSGSAFRLAPYVPAIRAGARQSPWYFASYFPVLVNDPYQVLVGGGPLFEYGQDADVCRPKKPARDAVEDDSSTDSEAEIAMGASGYVTKVVVRGGGVAIAGPGGVATVGRGGTAIVGPGGVAYTRPGALAVVGPGGKVMSQRNQGVYVSSREGNSARGRSDRQEGVLVAKGPVIYYDNFGERE